MTMGDGSATEKNTSASKAMDAYFEQADEWARDRLNLAEHRVKLAYWIAGVATALAIAGVTAVAMLAPLKSVEGYVVVVDKSTGQMEVITSLDKGGDNTKTWTEDTALSKANLAQYVVARETFDLADIEARHNQVRRATEKKLFDEFDRQFYANSASVNPFKLYEGSTRAIEIKSVEFFNDHTGQVRFTAHLKKDGSTQDSHWVAIVQFRYVQTPAVLKDRLANPLGFQVTSYRVDQESIQ